MHFSIGMQDPKEVEKQLFRNAPLAAQRLNSAAKKLIRIQKRKEWWTAHADEKRKSCGGYLFTKS